MTADIVSLADYRQPVCPPPVTAKSGYVSYAAVMSGVMACRDRLSRSQRDFVDSLASKRARIGGTAITRRQEAKLREIHNSLREGDAA